MPAHELESIDGMIRKATQMRQLAQARIVAAFREQLEGKSSGPTDEDLHAFARLAHVEEALHRSRSSLPLGADAVAWLDELARPPF
ncbi:hypothetical protein SRS16CHR_02595 [Variovorax sp. SRS16]|uniref:hypothetical protein n=1 Tax=Variovorax sp. SRS16 TaxID=282217 RepID=UPI00131957A9|nr:hypothetical protein [Variovorax sp. SRS16]VTU20202.1 hypothetical protein SRS16CHR_02595 [Variovorax sp. SRS16]